MAIKDYVKTLTEKFFIKTSLVNLEDFIKEGLHIPGGKIKIIGDGTGDPRMGYIDVYPKGTSIFAEDILDRAREFYTNRGFQVISSGRNSFDAFKKNEVGVYNLKIRMENEGYSLDVNFDRDSKSFK